MDHKPYDGPKQIGPKFGDKQQPTRVSTSHALSHNVIVGEAHEEPKITLNLNNGGDEIYGKKVYAVEPSKLAAAVIKKAEYKPPSSWDESWNQLNMNLALAAEHLAAADQIALGQDPQWGAENYLIGHGSTATNNPALATEQQNPRTHIEANELRAAGAFIRELSFPDRKFYHRIDTPTLRQAVQNNSKVKDILTAHKVKTANLDEYSAKLKIDWRALIGQFDYNQIKNESESAKIIRLKTFILSKVAEVANAITLDVTAGLDPQQFTAIIGAIKTKKYDGAEHDLGTLHARGALIRTLAQASRVQQLWGTEAENDSPDIPESDATHRGYIVGDSHIDDMLAIKNHTGKDNTPAPLAPLITASFVREADYKGLDNIAGTGGYLKKAP